MATTSEHNDIVDKVWRELEHFKHGTNSKQKNNPQQSCLPSCCSACNSKNLNNISNEYICCDCGLVLSQDFCVSSCSTSNTFESLPITRQARSKPISNNASLSRMQTWYMWSNDEKNAYKLASYTTSLCSKLDIHESLIPTICDTVVNVMTTIKRYDGTKRARVKDGIILTCIQYVLKDTRSGIPTTVLAKRIGLDIKYITKAETIILELINNNKLKLDKHVMLNVKSPFEYIQQVIFKNKLNIPEQVLCNVKTLIDICQQHDLLLDHTPLSVGVCCFYYIIKSNNIPIDIKLFSELYNLSVVTVIKTYNKLKQYEHIINTYRL